MAKRKTRKKKKIKKCPGRKPRHRAGVVAKVRKILKQSGFRLVHGYAVKRRKCT